MAGVTGDILEYSPYVYNSSNSADGPDFSSQWVLLTNGTGSAWAQDGWREFQGSNRQNIWVEFNDPGSASWDNSFPNSISINQVVQFWTQYDPSCTISVCFSWYAEENGTKTLLTTSRFNWTPTNAQTQSETHDQASQMPGGTSNKSSGTSLQAYYPAGSGGSWNAFNGTNGTSTSSGSVPSWDNVSPTGSGQSAYYTWDSACSS